MSRWQDRKIKWPEPALAPKYILRVDDLPKVVEADGRVWPVAMTLVDAARLFDIEYKDFRDICFTENLPIIYVSPARIFIEVGVFIDWLNRHSTTLAEIS